MRRRRCIIIFVFVSIPGDIVSLSFRNSCSCVRVLRFAASAIFSAVFSNGFLIFSRFSDDNAIFQTRFATFRRSIRSTGRMFFGVLGRRKVPVFPNGSDDFDTNHDVMFELKSVVETGIRYRHKPLVTENENNEYR